MFLLTLAAILTGLFHIRAEYAPQSATTRWQVYLFKPLTTSLIIGVAWLANWQNGGAWGIHYATLILVGLLFSLAGDIFLMLLQDRFLHGLVSFLIAHLFYIAAFTWEQGLYWGAWWLVPYLGYGLCILLLILPFVGNTLKLPVILYMLVILVMAWQATQRWQAFQTNAAAFAMIGAIFFVLSDSLLAYDHFRKPFRSAHALVLGTYYIAQLLIAWSIRTF